MSPGPDVCHGHRLVEVGGGRETLDDCLVVADEAHLIPVRGDAVEEGRDAFGRQLAHDATTLRALARIVRPGSSASAQMPDAAVRAATTAMAPP